MSNWQQKSESSLQVANDLSLGFANQSVHCSYYSCVQFIYHLMFSEMNETEEELNNGNAKAKYETSLPKNRDGSTQKVGTHVWLQRELYRSLRSRAIEDEAIDIEQLLNDISVISNVRVTADYKSELILPKRAQGIHKKATQVINTLKAIY